MQWPPPISTVEHMMGNLQSLRMTTPMRFEFGKSGPPK